MLKLQTSLMDFLQTHCRKGASYGLAYSGGTDSKALLYTLLECIQTFPIHLVVLHVDHSWREQSHLQANKLEEEMKALSLRFYRLTLEKPIAKNNLEDRGRQKRLEFFEKMTKKCKLEGIFLAHHADDLAETVLKRVFEGANLENLQGMPFVKTFSSMTLFRPFLKMRKKDLQAYLDHKNLEAIYDQTNEDPRFLRARMRKDILPILEKHFGKNITDNLMLLSKRSSRLNTCLEEKTKKFSLKKVYSPMGFSYDFTHFFDLDFFEQSFLLKKVLKKEKIDLSYKPIEKIRHWLSKRAANKKFISKQGSFFCERGFFFFQRESIEVKPYFYPLSLGRQNIHFMSISFQENFEKSPSLVGWKAFWRGHMRCALPIGEFEIRSFSSLENCQKKVLQKRREKMKIPVFLRKKIPIICQNGKVFRDLLDLKEMSQYEAKRLFELKINL